MTVVHVVVAGEVGGAERMLVDLARGGERPHAVALVTPNDRLRSLFGDAGLDVDDRGQAREGPLTYLKRSLGRADVAWLVSILERRRAAVVHLHTFASQVVGTRAALRTGARILRTEHSTRVYDDMSCWPFSSWSLRRSDAAVCISEHVRKVARARAPWAAPIFDVVYNGIDVARFDARPLPPVDPHAPRIRLLALGRLEPRKGLDVALRALARVPTAELEIVGEGEARTELESLARTLGIADRVHFAGFVSDVRGAIERSHAAISSARSEGLGIALLEAMAMGRPVIALPTGGVPEIVRDGETGWLATGSDEHALARAIRDAATRADELARRGERAHRNVAAAFSLDRMRAAYERHYAALATR